VVYQHYYRHSHGFAAVDNNLHT